MDSHLLDLSYAMQTPPKNLAVMLLKGIAIFFWMLAEVTIGLILMPFVLPFVSKAERRELGC